MSDLIDRLLKQLPLYSEEKLQKAALLLLIGCHVDQVAESTDIDAETLRWMRLGCIHKSIVDAVYDEFVEHISKEWNICGDIQHIKNSMFCRIVRERLNKERERQFDQWKKKNN